MRQKGRSTLHTEAASNIRIAEMTEAASVEVEEPALKKQKTAAAAARRTAPKKTKTASASATPEPAAQEAIKKRPASWLHSGAAAVYKVPSRHEGREAIDADSGEEDVRQTSRAQRAVFERNIDSIDPEMKHRYQQIKSKDCKERNKLQIANAIVNAHTCRAAKYGDGIMAKPKTWERILKFGSFRKKSEGKVGFGKYVMIGKVFAGNEALFEKAKAAGQVYELNGEWFHDESRDFQGKAM